MLPFTVFARRVAVLALLLVVGPLAPAARAQSAAPFGISHMQVGLQNSWSSQMSEQTKLNPLDQHHSQRNNYGLGLNGRLQWSLLDMLHNTGNAKTRAGAFRIVDVMAAETGAGYLQDNLDSKGAYVNIKETDRTLWWNFGIDLGLAALVRVATTVDIGVKCRYSGYFNATFMGTKYNVSANPINIGGGYLGTSYSYEKGGRDLKGYGGAYVWSGLARAGRLYGEYSLMRGFNKNDRNANPTYVNVLDLKYQYGSPKGAWAPYVGLQVGLGATTASDEYSGFNSTFSRNWVQVSIGKMTNF